MRQRGVVIGEMTQGFIRYLAGQDSGPLGELVLAVLDESEGKPHGPLSGEAARAWEAVGREVARMREMHDARASAGRKGMASRWGDVPISDNTPITNDNRRITRREENRKEKKRGFPPSREEVRAYAEEAGLPADDGVIGRFLDYNGARGWRGASDDWRAAYRLFAAKDMERQQRRGGGGAPAKTGGGSDNARKLSRCASLLGLPVPQAAWEVFGPAHSWAWDHGGGELGGMQAVDYVIDHAEEGAE